jgi:hypothetical protein
MPANGFAFTVRVGGGGLELEEIYLTSYSQALAQELHRCLHLLYAIPAF